MTDGVAEDGMKQRGRNRAAASPMTKAGRADVCVDICDTVSRQMYVISFRRVEQGGVSKRERERRKRTSE